MQTSGFFVLPPGITPMVQNNTFFPEMCPNGVNTQRVYSQGVIQKPLEDPKDRLAVR